MFKILEIIFVFSIQYLNIISFIFAYIIFFLTFALGV